MKKITIDGQDIPISDESFEALKKSLLKKDRFVPEDEQTYYYVNSWGEKCSSAWSGGMEDTICLGQGNVFATREEAEEHAEKLKAISDVVNYCYENDLVTGEGDERYYIFYSQGKKYSFGVYQETDKFADILPTLKSSEACKQVINEKKEQLDIIFGVK